MTTLIPLLCTFAGLWVLGLLLRRPIDAGVRGRIAAAVTFVSTGVMHFLEPAPLVEMVPPGIPAPKAVVFATGLLELVLAVGLLVPWTRRMAAWSLAAFLLAVLPANIYAALNHVGFGAHAEGPGYLWIRIPVQALLIGWVLWFGTRGPKR